MLSAAMVVSDGSTPGVLPPDLIVVRRYKKPGQTGTLGDGRFRVRSECDGLPKVLVMARRFKSLIKPVLR
jgi:hypothetical protein